MPSYVGSLYDDGSFCGNGDLASGLLAMVHTASLFLVS